MDTDNNPEATEGNLDDFTAEFFGTKPEEKEVETVEGDQENTPAPTEDDQETEQNTEDSDDENEDVGEEEGKFKVPKKLTARERIEQLNAKFREEERLRLAEESRRRETEARLQELEKKLQNPATEQEVKTENKGPAPTDKGEDGEDKYPLGEYDPDYIRDLARYEARQARDEVQRELRQEREKEAAMAQLQQISNEWTTKVAASTERLPDLAEKVSDLERSLADSPQEIVESLAVTVMGLENGPDVLYYLAQNVEEARRIAQGGPQALIALGKIDAMVKPVVEKTEVKKITEASEPPPRTRGMNGQFGVSPDTNDLDAFTREFFKGK